MNKPQVNVIAGQHMTTGTVDNEPMAVWWQVGDAFYVGAAGQEPVTFSTGQEASDAFFKALLSGVNALRGEA